MHLDLKAVFYTSSALTKIWWYPDRRSILENTTAPCNWSIRSSILGRWFLFL